MQGLPEHGHEPVMVKEVLEFMALPSLKEKAAVMDCTIGRGGHAVRIAAEMEKGAGGTLIGLDVDPENLKFARKRLESHDFKRVELRTFHANFGEASDVLEALGLSGVDRLFADFGVSTNQLLEKKHGLSFSADVTLDMRLDPRIARNAADLVAQLDEKELADILHEYAQERYAWRIARKIVQTRGDEPILTTGQLARLVRSVIPGKWSQIDPATRTFQALRMAVNSELQSIDELLDAAPRMMKRNVPGRAVFLSFHSGEDRLVKQAVRRWEEGGVGRSLTKKPLEPGESEMHGNARSRSAKLRAFEFMGATGRDDAAAA